MLDYHAHIAALKVLQADVSAWLVQNPDPALQSVNNATKAQPAYAALGALLDLLFEHVSDSDREISLLTEASDIWKDISGLLTKVAQLRQDLESLVSNSAQPDVLVKFNNLSVALHGLAPEINSLMAKLQAIFAELELLSHVTQHGQQLDKPVKDWSWRDIILSRRTGAFASALTTMAKAEGTKESLAFAYGAVSCYAANVLGSSYLNQTVRGARRAHPIRYRLAEYSAGAWLRIHQSNLTMSIPALRALITFGPPGSPSLPVKLAKLIESSLNQTYGGRIDINKAYKKLLNHLDLLTAFPELPIPLPIDNAIWAKGLDKGLEGYDGPLGTAQQSLEGDLDEGADNSDWPTWKVVVIVVVAVLCALIAALLAGGGSGGKTPSPSSFPDPVNDSSEAQSYLVSDEAVVQVSVMFNLHTTLWQLAITALKAAKLLGLLYPESIDFPEPQFSQFTAIPLAPFNTFHRPVADPNEFLLPPTSPPEHPAGNISPYPVGSDPSVFLFGIPGATLGVNLYGRNLWTREAHGGVDSELRTINRNLDADRGFQDQCWKLKSGLMTTDPLLTEILAYDSI